MKLNKKGAGKIIDAVELGLHVDEHGQDFITANLNEKEIEFESDDFQDAVVLSVEDAKKLDTLLHKLYGSALCALPKEDKELWDCLKKRIVQAGKEK